MDNKNVNQNLGLIFQKFSKNNTALSIYFYLFESGKVMAATGISELDLR